jgi:serine/threonine protein kinase
LVLPIEEMTGLVTSDGWVLEELVQKQVYQTGSCFSVGYLVKHTDGRSGFLKALDFSRAQKATDKVRALESMTRTYNFERDVLALCRGANLNKVVVAISDGSLTVPAAPFGEVFYLIFELADGDVRKHAVMTNLFDAAWSLHALHNIAIGLSQLHGQGIHHQDLKPSNVLVFEGGKTSKLADLGRSHCNTIAAPHDDFNIAGQPYYAPPEHLYGYWMNDSRKARAAADLYLLGSMVFFFFTGAMLTPSILSYVRPEHKPPFLSPDNTGWNGTFEDVLPYIRSGYADAIFEFQEAVNKSFRNEHPKVADGLIEIISYLTEPDPGLRGHVLDRRMKYGNQYALNRFVSAFAKYTLMTSIKSH